MLIITLPTAVPTPDVGVLKNILGFFAYPLPLEVMLIAPIPAESVTRTAVAAAPTPYDVDPTPVIVEEALTIVTVGVTVRFNVATESQPAELVKVSTCVPALVNVKLFQVYGS